MSIDNLNRAISLARSASTFYCNMPNHLNDLTSQNNLTSVTRQCQLANLTQPYLLTNKTRQCQTTMFISAFTYNPDMDEMTRAGQRGCKTTYN